MATVTAHRELTVTPLPPTITLPISVEKGVFFRPKSTKRGHFSNLGTSVVYALVGSVCVCVGGGGLI